MIAYKHQNAGFPYPRCTVALDLPFKSTLLDMVSLGDELIGIDLGVTFVHPNDEYNKSTGRFQATLKMTVTPCVLKKVTIRERSRVVFEIEGKVMKNDKQGKLLEYTVILGVSFVPESPKTRLEYLYVV